MLLAKGIRAAIPPHTYDYDKAARRKGIYKCSKNLIYEKLKMAMLDFLDTQEGMKLLETRKHDIEPTIGDIKHNMGFRKLLLRRIPKVTAEIGSGSYCPQYQENTKPAGTGEASKLCLIKYFPNISKIPIKSWRLSANRLSQQFSDSLRAPYI